MAESSQFSTKQPADSIIQPCPYNENKDTPCDINGLKLAVITDSSRSAVCRTSRVERDTNSLLEKLPVSDHSKYKLVTKYDVILEAKAPILVANQDKKAHFHAELIPGEGACGGPDHHGLVLTPRGSETHDELKTATVYVNSSHPPYGIYAMSTGADDYIAKTMQVIAWFWMFIDTHAEEFIKTIEVEGKACGIRTDGQKPVKSLKGLVRIYRDDFFTLSLKLPVPKLSKKSSLYKVEQSYQGSEKTHSTATYSKTTKNGLLVKESFTADGNKVTKSYDDKGAYVQYEKETSGYGYTKKDVHETTKDPRQEVFLETGTLVIKRNGHDLDVAEKINRILELKRQLESGVDFLQELKSSIPKAGILVDANFEFLCGTIEAKWGLDNNAKSTTEYQWLTPKFQGELKLLICALAVEIGIGIDTVSPSILNWWGKKAWEIVLKVSCGFSGELSLKSSLLFDENSEFPTRDVEPGCSYQGDNGKEKQLLVNEVEIKPTFKAVAKVNVYGIGAEAQANLVGSFKSEAAVVMPFNVRYKAELDSGKLVCHYTHGLKKPSPPAEYDMWKKKVIEKGNYLYDGRTK